MTTFQHMVSGWLNRAFSNPKVRIGKMFRMIRMVVKLASLNANMDVPSIPAKAKGTTSHFMKSAHLSIFILSYSMQTITTTDTSIWMMTRRQVPSNAFAAFLFRTFMARLAKMYSKLTIRITARPGCLSMSVRSRKRTSGVPSSAAAIDSLPLIVIAVSGAGKPLVGAALLRSLENFPSAGKPSLIRLPSSCTGCSTQPIPASSAVPLAMTTSSAEPLIRRDSPAAPCAASRARNSFAAEMGAIPASFTNGWGVM
mmetsp:Transcript_110492/g.291741  ORF Transcript_110492/g.291741 Transcript_110492/m.291741 type:complete len:255 (-) Transcript_110492:39-803(-)